MRQHEITSDVTRPADTGPDGDANAWSALRDDRRPWLELSVRRPLAGVTVLDVGGELDLAVCPLLDRKIEENVRARSCRRLVVDLTGLRFIGARGLRSLERAQRTASTHRTELRLVVNTRVVARPIQLAHLDDTFPISRTRAAATL